MQQFGAVAIIVVGVTLINFPAVLSQYTVRIGATASMTGTNTGLPTYGNVPLGKKVPSRHDPPTPGDDVFKGLTLLREEANRLGAFKTRNGMNITVSISIMDDGGNLSQAKLLYQQMASSHDLFIGPSNGAFTQEVINVTNTSASFCMMHAPSSELAFQMGYTNVFTVAVPFKEYFNAGLEAAQKNGARTVGIFTHFAPGSIGALPCVGARQKSADLGMLVSPVTYLTVTATVVGIKDLQRLHGNPDVIVYCGLWYDAVSMLNVARALDLTAQVVLMTDLIELNFRKAVSGSTANYLQQPAIWDAGIPATDACQSACKVFPSPAEFDRIYELRWGQKPTVYAAAAVGAGLAVLMAIEGIDSSLNPQYDSTGKPIIGVGLYREWLLLSQNQNLSTFFGKLSYNKTGLRTNARVYTYQLKPSLDLDPFLRYWNSRYELVTSANPARYPIPTFLQKSIEVYPCHEGYYMLVTAGQKVNCTACPEGTSRNNLSLRCTPCGPGTYAIGPALAECNVCEKWMSCDNRTNIGHPPAAFGYYKFDYPALKYIKCNPPHLCVGLNRCAGHNTGIMCMQCPSDFTRKSINWHSLAFKGDRYRNSCQKCPNFFVSIGVIGVFSVAAYWAIIFLIDYCHRLEAHSISDVGSVVVRIFINYLHFTAIMLEATNFAQDYPVLKALSRLMLDPLDWLVSFDCVLEDVQMQAFSTQAKPIIGLMMVPCFLLLNYLSLSLMACVKLQRAYALGTMSSKHSAETTTNVASITKQGTLRRRNFRASDWEDEEGGRTAQLLDAESSSSEEDPLMAGMDCFDGGEAQKLARNKNFDKLRDHQEHLLAQTFSSGNSLNIVTLFLAHPIACYYLAQGFECDEVEVFRLRDYTGVKCTTTDNFVYDVSRFGFVFAALSVPLYYLWQLQKSKGNLMTADVRLKFGFLHNGYETDYYFFELYCMFRKVLLILALIVPELYMRLLVCLWLSLSYLAHLLTTRPWDTRCFNIFFKLDCSSIFALITCFSCRIVIEMHRRYDERRDEKNYPQTGSFWPISKDGSFFEYSLIAMCWLTHIHFLGLMVYALLRNYFIRRTLTMREYDDGGGTIGTVSKLLLYFERNRSHHMRFYCGRILDSSASLSWSEKKYLKQALCSTLERYFKDTAIVNLYHLSAALDKAFATCERCNKKRVTALENRSQNRCCGCLLRSRFSRNMQMEEVRQAKGNRSSLSYAIKHYSTPSHYGATVEDLSSALMLCGPRILQRDKRFFRVTPARELHESRSLLAKQGKMEWKGESVGALFLKLALRDGHDLVGITSEEEYVSEMDSGRRDDSEEGDNVIFFATLGLESTNNHRERRKRRARKMTSLDDWHAMTEEQNKISERLLALFQEATNLRAQCMEAASKPSTEGFELVAAISPSVVDRDTVVREITPDLASAASDPVDDASIDAPKPEGDLRFDPALGRLVSFEDMVRFASAAGRSVGLSYWQTLQVETRFDPALGKLVTFEEMVSLNAAEGRAVGRWHWFTLQAQASLGEEPAALEAQQEFRLPRLSELNKDLRDVPVIVGAATAADNASLGSAFKTSGNATVEQRWQQLQFEKPEPPTEAELFQARIEHMKRQMLEIGPGMVVPSRSSLNANVVSPVNGYDSKTALSGGPAMVSEPSMTSQASKTISKSKLLPLVIGHASNNEADEVPALDELINFINKDSVPVKSLSRRSSGLVTNHRTDNVTPAVINHGSQFQPGPVENDQSFPCWLGNSLSPTVGSKTDVGQTSV